MFWWFVVCFFTLRCGVDSSWSSSFSSLFTGAVCNSSITFKQKWATSKQKVSIIPYNPYRIHKQCMKKNPLVFALQQSTSTLFATRWLYLCASCNKSFLITLQSLDTQTHSVNSNATWIVTVSCPWDGIPNWNILMSLAACPTGRPFNIIPLLYLWSAFTGHMTQYFWHFLDQLWIKFANRFPRELRKKRNTFSYIPYKYPQNTTALICWKSGFKEKRDKKGDQEFLLTSSTNPAALCRTGVGLCLS